MAVAGLGLPVGMVVSSRSAPLLLAVAAVLALAGVWRDGHVARLAATVRQAGSTPMGRALAATLLYFAVSLTWTQFAASGLFAFAELVASIAGAAVLAACWTLSPPRQLGRWFAAGLILGAGLTVADLATDMMFRQRLGARSRTFLLNRTVVSELIVFWPVAVLAFRQDRRLAALAGGLILLAIWYSESGAARLGLAVGAIAGFSAYFATRLTVVGLAAGALLLLVAAPWIGPILDRAMPAQVHVALQDMHSRDRVNIWRSFGAAVAERPAFGSGFNASARMAEDAVAARVQPPNRVLLGAGHPHNALLQVWVEGGAIGAALVAWLFVAVAGALLRLKSRPVAAAAAALAGCGIVIAAVSHGAWQGWWIASVGLSIVLVQQARNPEGDHG